MGGSGALSPGRYPAVTWPTMLRPAVRVLRWQSGIRVARSCLGAQRALVSGSCPAVCSVGGVKGTGIASAAVALAAPGQGRAATGPALRVRVANPGAGPDGCPGINAPFCDGHPSPGDPVPHAGKTVRRRLSRPRGRERVEFGERVASGSAAVMLGVPGWAARRGTGLLQPGVDGLP